jgi:hypothetical protein
MPPVRMLRSKISGPAAPTPGNNVLPATIVLSKSVIFAPNIIDIPPPRSAELSEKVELSIVPMVTAAKRPIAPPLVTAVLPENVEL